MLVVTKIKDGSLPARHFTPPTLMVCVMVYARSLHLTVLMCNSRADKKEKRALTERVGVALEGGD